MGGSRVPALWTMQIDCPTIPSRHALIRKLELDKEILADQGHRCGVDRAGSAQITSPGLTGANGRDITVMVIAGMAFPLAK